MVPKRLALLTIPIVLVNGCGETDPDALPEIRLGDSVCIECGMIVSDDRFGTATVIEGDRGSEPLIFDDYNCQKIFEFKHPDLNVIRRWSRDYETLAWFRTGEGWLVSSRQIRTPMASDVAGFDSIERAQEFAESVSGEVITYDAYDTSSEP
jgi:nitrous oxide reductase accessory protein NosL